MSLYLKMSMAENIDYVSVTQKKVIESFNDLRDYSGGYGVDISSPQLEVMIDIGSARRWFYYYSQI